MQDPTTQGRPTDELDDGRGRHRSPASLAAADDSVEVIRSEERMLIGTVLAPVELVRIHRDVVVEQVTQTFEVRREVLRVEREPIPAGAAGDGYRGAPVHEVVEVVLREERPVVRLEVVPVERVRIGVVSVQEVVQVADDVRVERVEVDAPVRGGGEGPGRAR